MFFLFSCNSDSTVSDDNKTPGTLYAMGTRSETPLEAPGQEAPKPDPGEAGETEPTPPPADYPPLELVFTGDDIKSFNVTTNKITFSDEIAEKLINSWYHGLTLHLNEKPLFEDELTTWYLHDSNLWWGYVVLQVQFDFDETLNKRINPQFHLFNSERKENQYGEYAITYDPVKRQKDWDSFIKYLSNAGKIIK
jgi:hypothetical protein